MRLEVKGLSNGEEDGVNVYYANVVVNGDVYRIKIPKRKFFRAAVGNKIEVTKRELNDSVKVSESDG